MKRKLKKYAKQAKVETKNLLASASSHKLALFNTTILFWLVFRTEQIHSMLTHLTDALDAMFNVTMLLAFKLQAAISDAQDAFTDAVRSIASLLGGDGA